MPATDTAPQPDTTPPSPAAESKAAGRRAVVAKQDPPAEPEPATDTAEPEPPAEDPPAEPEPGWFRNTAATELTVMPVQYPSKTLKPGQATWLPDDPRHPDLQRCDAPSPDETAADTAGSEQ